MDLLDRLLGHDAWTTRQLLEICATLTDEQLDQQFDIGHRTLRATLNHIISNMEIWSALMAGDPIERQTDQTIQGMRGRLSVAENRLQSIAVKVQAENGWDHLWTDHLDDPPREKTFGTALAHIITHSMHHRAQVLYMLRLSGVQELPEGDVFSWENNTKRG
ncbi:DinB family protein [uncultured Gimesia sp.]|uniref:DinB family protein n=1 Tax=uncultured Gimesia sp. TaxID=1678688 RepID=UPI0030DD389C|tara:strand:- start:37104 stop:37589 length:486 start_codon:yes stop_codon:yes gene_type:complete